MIKTKIIVTVGPSSAKYDIIRAFIKEGVSGFRINFSHGDPAIWDEYVKLIKEAEEEIGRYPAIIGDLRGPQLRIGELKSFNVRRGDRVTLFYGNKSDEEGFIPVENRKLFEALEPGDIILLDDGKIKFHVQEVLEDNATLIALNEGVVSSRKTIIVSGKDLELPVLTKYDMECIKYAVNKRFTYLALSYVRDRRDVDTLRDVLVKIGGKGIGVISKIETKSAMKNLGEIIEGSDAVLIARGDLGMHYSLEEVPFLQRVIAEKALMMGKPVIVATQLLDSMVNRPQPTRSEVVDVMNAVMDYVDALMLTNETAIGNYPIEAVKWLKKIVREAERWLVAEGAQPASRTMKYHDLRDKYARGLVLLAESLNAKILVYTKTGLMPSRISRFRPRVTVYAGTSNIGVARKLSIYNGINPIIVDAGKEYDYDKGLTRLYEKLLEEGELLYGDIVLLTYGMREEALYVIKTIQVL